MYASKRFFIQEKVIFKDPLFPIFRTIYEIKDITHKQTIQRDTDNNITEDTDMWIKRDYN